MTRQGAAHRRSTRRLLAALAVITFSGVGVLVVDVQPLESTGKRFAAGSTAPSTSTTTPASSTSTSSTTSTTSRAASPAKATASSAKGAVDRNPDRNGDRIADDLAANLGSGDRQVRVRVSDPSRAANEIAAAGVATRSVTPIAGTDLVKVVLDANAIRQLASVRNVRLIESDPKTTAIPEPKVSASNEKAASRPAGEAAKSIVVRDKNATPLAREYGTTVLQTVTDADPNLARERTRLGITGDGDGNPYRYTTADVGIAVIDTGIDDAHVAFSGGKVLTHVDFTTRSASCGPGPDVTGRWDDAGHGTHVASIAAGSDERYSGVAPGATLVDLKVFDCSPNGSMSDVDAALGWVKLHAAEYNIRVVNLSLGADYLNSGTDSTSRLVNQLTARGIQVAVAAGNTGPNGSTIGSPGSAEFATTVGAMASSFPTEWLAPFSSQGPTLDGRPGIDVVAPGVGIFAAQASTADNHTVYSGTSMASPFVAGVYALLAQARPTAAPLGTECADSDTSSDCLDGVVDVSMRNDARAFLTSSAQDWFAPGVDPLTGYGALRAGRALDLATSTPTQPDTYIGAGSITSAFVGNRPIVVPVDTTNESATVQVALSSDPDMFVGAPFTASVLDATGKSEVLAPTWTTLGMGFAYAYNIARVTSWRVPVSGGKRWIQIVPHAAPGMSGAITVAGRGIGTFSEGLRLVSSTPADEGGSAVSVTLISDLARSAALTFAVHTGPALSSTMSQVTLPAGPAGTQVTIPVRGTDDSVNQGLHTGTLSLVPTSVSDNVTPILRESVTIRDNDTGPIGTRRPLFNGRELPPGTWFNSAPIIVNGTTFATLRGQAFAATAQYGLPVIARPGGDFQPIGLAANGAYLWCSSRVLGLTADGSKVVATAWPACASQAVPGAPAQPIAFTHDLTTGQNVSLIPTYVTAQIPWYTDLPAFLSDDGASLAYAAPVSSAVNADWAVVVRNLVTGTDEQYDQRSSAYKPWIMANNAGRVAYTGADPSVAPDASIVIVDRNSTRRTYVPNAVDGKSVVASTISRNIAVVAQMLWTTQVGDSGYASILDVATGVRTAKPVANPNAPIPYASLYWVSDNGDQIAIGTQEPAYSTPDARTASGETNVIVVVDANGDYTLAGGATIGSFKIPLFDANGAAAIYTSRTEIDGDTNGALDVVLNPPAAPKGVIVGPPSNLRAVASGDGVDISWDPVSGARGYVMTGLDPTASLAGSDDVGNVTSVHVPSNLFLGASTTVFARGDFLGVGRTAAWGAAAPPRLPIIRSVDVTGTSLSLIIDGLRNIYGQVDATSFVAQYSIENGAWSANIPVTATTLSYNSARIDLGGFAPTTRYRVRIAGVNAYGRSPFSEPSFSTRTECGTPQITNVSPNRALAGETVTITGCGLLSASGVSFNGTAASDFIVVSPSTITATVPAGATSGPISVVLPLSTLVSPTSFTVKTAVTVTASSPAPVQYGVSVPAIGFATSPAVSASAWSAPPTCAVYASTDTGFANSLTGVLAAGNYVTHCSGGTSDSVGVTGYVDGTYIVQRASVTVTAASPSSASHGAAAPSVSFTTNPVIAAGSWTTLPVCAVYSSTDTAFTAPLTGTLSAGAYVTRCSGGTASNYVVTAYVNGAFLVNARVPDPVTSLTATSGPTRVSLAWNAPADNGGAAITRYDVRYSVTSGMTLETLVTGATTGTPPARTYAISSLVFGVPYYFQVRAVNAAGLGAWGPVTPAQGAIATVPGAPATPIALRNDFSSAKVTSAGSMVTGGDAITSYTFTSSPGALTCTATSPTVGCSVTGLMPGVSYTFTAQATNSIGSSVASAPSGAVTAVGRTAFATTANTVDTNVINLTTSTSTQVPVGARMLVYVTVDTVTATTPALTSVTFPNGGAGTCVINKFVLAGQSKVAGSGIRGGVVSCAVTTPIPAGGIVRLTLSKAPARAVAMGEYFVGFTNAGTVKITTPKKGKGTAPLSASTTSTPTGSLVVGSVFYENGTLSLASDVDVSGGAAWNPVTQVANGIAGSGGLAASRQYKFGQAPALYTYGAGAATAADEDWIAIAVTIR